MQNESQSKLIDFLQQFVDQSREDIANCLRKPKSELKYNNLVQQIIKSNADTIYEILEASKNEDNKEVEQQNKEKIEQLEEIVKTWSLDIAENEQRVHRDQLKQCAAVLIPYGSILLGVADTKSDIDLICVAPSTIDRHQHFFQGLYNILMNTKGVEQINKIESTTNPIIKMIFKGLHIDINFAQLNLDTLPKNIDDHLDELRQNLFQGEEKSVNALNGRKNGILIRNSVVNQNQFVESLKIVKLWAKRRGISGNILGYLGGISWAILVSKICQLFPNLDSLTTVDIFFKVYSLWNWQNYISIDDSDQENKFSQLCWKDEQNERKQFELMKIITPAYPYINSSYKVRDITFRTMMDEFRRGAELNDWNKVIEDFDFLNYFQHYFTISIVSDDEQNFHKWIGFCEAQLPKFQKILTTDEKQISLDNDQQNYDIRINSKGYEGIEKDFKCSFTYLIGIKKLNKQAWPLFFRSPVTKFTREFMEKKHNNLFNEKFNMKIYLQNYQDFIKKLPQQNGHHEDFYDEPARKKVKLQSQISQSDQKEDKRIQSLIDDIF
ncbi:hypothetical protein pb186bvf_016349 [Paramecium bursaria]